MKQNIFFVVAFDTHKGQRFVDNENSNMGTDNEFNAKYFETESEAKSWIENDKDCERLYIVEVENFSND